MTLDLDCGVADLGRSGSINELSNVNLQFPIIADPSRQVSWTRLNDNEPTTDFPNPVPDRQAVRARLRDAWLALLIVEPTATTCWTSRTSPTSTARGECRARGFLRVVLTHLAPASIPFTVRSVFVIDPKGIIRTTLSYPASTGRQLYVLGRRRATLLARANLPGVPSSATRSSASSTVSSSVTPTRSPPPPTGSRAARSLSTLPSPPRPPRRSSRTPSRCARWPPAIAAVTDKPCSQVAKPYLRFTTL